jgi:UBX domain-containing protein 1
MSSFREIRERDSGSRGGGSGGPKIGRIQHNQEDEDDEDEGDEDESKGPANFYTGGERSGLSVQNPDRGRGRDEEDQPEMVRQILQQAEALGKQLAEGGGAGSSSSGRGGGTVGSTNLGFSGRGRTIGDESSTEQTPSTSTSNQPTSNDRMDQDQDQDEDDELDQISSEPVIRRITFWADGFSIGDGPLITSSDPRHEEILKAINAKRAPLALLNVAFGQEVELRIEKRINEKYKPPPPEPMKAFGGSGNRLGSPAPTFTPTTTTTTTNVGESKPAPASEVKLDESQPITQIQLRLGDGSRLVGRFNHTHTVADIRGFINT